MNLTLFFRLITGTLFHKTTKLEYQYTLFYLPRIVAKDGFSVSLQIHRGNYCASENGYRSLGHTWDEVEFGFPSHSDDLFIDYAENPGNLTETVGRIPVSVLEKIFDNHGGIDWEQTISVDWFKRSMLA